MIELKKILFTLYYLRPVQVYGRIIFKLYKPKVKTHSLRERPGNSIQFPLLREVSCIAPSTFIFLNEKHILDPYNMWNCNDVSRLWLYNLHYFDDLNAKGDTERTELHRNLILKWIKENPTGKGAGWEPYPLSLRIVNWIKWHLNGNKLNGDELNSLAVQACFLRNRLEYHLLANHLFANAKALLFAGLFFEGKEAEKWVKKGLSILDSQIPEQILSDGGNFERSPMYHSIMVEDMLDIISISQNYRHPLITSGKIDSWKKIAQKMLYWLKAMYHDGVGISLFNDSAFGIAPDYGQLITYAECIGVKIDSNHKRITDLPDTGYVSIKNDLYTMIIDAGDIGPDYQPGHGHADTLSFELSINQKPFIVDSGVSCYGTGEERFRQRSTPAHNTIVVDGQDSSEVWGGFRVARRAKIRERKVEINKDKSIISASHDGYRRIKGVGNHRRTWITEDAKITIIDNIEGSGKHCITEFIHFHPDLEIILNGNIIECLCSANKWIKLYLDNSLEIRLSESTYHPRFGVSLKNKKLVMKADVVLPFSSKTIIEF